MNPRESALPRPVAMRLAGAEYDRCTEMFRSLTSASTIVDDLLNTEVPY
jgi:hypothetical protein